MKYKVDCSFNKDRIELYEGFVADEYDATSIHQKLTTQIINLRDNAVRQALIELGWTPPPEGKPCD